jgi:hypothetical protein
MGREQRDRHVDQIRELEEVSVGQGFLIGAEQRRVFSADPALFHLPYIAQKSLDPACARPASRVRRLVAEDLSCDPHGSSLIGNEKTAASSGELVVSLEHP